MINLSNDLRDARLQLLADALSGGTLTLYTAPKPAIGAAITTQTALATLLLPDGLTVSNAQFSMVINAVTTADTGTCTWGRIVDSADAFVLDGDAGIPGSSALFTIKTTTMTAGDPLTVVAAVFSEP